MRSHKPILVTGTHRSGTTWVGKVLSASDDIGYIFEPFKPTIYPGIMPQPVPCKYLYLCRDNEAEFRDRFDRVLKFDFGWGAAWQTVRSPRDAVRVLRRGFRQRGFKRRGCRPLLKDPFALFSAEWLAQNFDVQNVVVIRHPAAFVSSLKVKRWEFDFNHFLSQPLLLRDLLGPFEKEINELVREKQSIIIQGTTIWNCIYHVVNQLRRRHPDWIFIRHEDISRNPQKGFQELYQRLGIPFDQRARSRIEDLSGEHNPSERTTGGRGHRNSRENIRNWKHRLTPEEIETVRQRTASVAPLFYSDSDW